MSGNRIWVGEVRGREAMEMLKLWTSGHPGGGCTLHSDIVTPHAALSKVEQYVSEVTQSPMQRLIADAVGLIVCMEKTGSGQRRVSQIVSVQGFDGDNYRLKTEDKV